MAGLSEIRENLRKEARDNGYCFYELSYADGFKTWRKTRDESAEQVEAEFKRYNAERLRQKLDPVEVPTVVQIKEEEGHKIFSRV